MRPCRAWCLLLAVVVIAEVAHAAPNDRVVLADPDPELLRAVTTTLAPWRFEIVVDPDPPANTSEAQQRAEQRSARFVVWRRDGDLVVFDRERGAAEHREGRVGALDPIDAAAAALTVKTLMRLPPPEAPGVPPPIGTPGTTLRLQLGSAARFNAVATGARFAGIASIRPWTTGLGFGVAGDLGTAADVEQSGFRGSWSDWAVLAVVSWTHERAPWRIEPFVAAGILRSALDGVAMMEVIDQQDVVGAVRGGVHGAWAWNRFSVGISLAVEGVTSTPTYTKAGASAEIFEVPAIGVVAGLFVAVDLGL
jgi:hypothetical protein